MYTITHNKYDIKNRTYFNIKISCKDWKQVQYEIGKIMISGYESITVELTYPED